MFSTYEKKLLIVLLGIVVIGSIIFGGDFLSFTTLLILANQLPEYGLISIALMLTLIISGMNLSIVSMVTLSGVVGAMVMDAWDQGGIISALVGVVAMILVGIATGLINGVVITYFEVTPIVTTLGTMLFFRGLALNITKGGAITSFSHYFTGIGSGTILGIPMPILILTVTLVIIYYLLGKNELGLQLYRLGKDPNAAKYSGINIKRITILAYMISGVIAGITALVMTARYNSIRVDYGSSYLIYGFVIVTLGGIDIKGGKGSIIGVIIALLIVSLLLRLLNLAFVDSNVVDGIIGLILLVNLVIQHFSDRMKKLNNA